jgi:peptide/nickel transport system permease protein
VASLILRRISFSATALLLASIVLFALTRAIPESPARMVLGSDATPQQLSAFEHEHGLDRSLLAQYAGWLGALVLHGDFGKSLVTGQSINRRIVDSLPVTLELVVVAFTFALLVSFILGTLAAVYEGTAIDHLSRIFAVLGVSVPGFWLGLLLILVFAVNLSWFPPGGIVPPSSGILAHANSLVLPSFCLGVFYTAILSRMTRSSLIDVLGQDYIRTARAMGLSRTLVFRYALKNAMVPVVTIAAMSFGYMFGWAIIIEYVFNIGGMSSALLTAVNQRDYTLLQGVVFVFSLVFLVANLIADLLNAWLNPKLRTARR